MNSVDLNFEKRTATRQETQALRAAGRVPCTVYGYKKEPLSISVLEKDFKEIVGYPRHNIIVNLKSGRTSLSCIVKEHQINIISSELIHLDFMVLDPKRPVKVNIPVRSEGTAPGVLVGGVLHQVSEVAHIKALPKALKEELVIDVSSLEIGSKFRFEDLPQEAGLQILDSPRNVIYSVAASRASRKQQKG